MINVKSLWSLRLGPRTSCNGFHKGKRGCEGEQIPKKDSQFGLQSATRLHEAGTASNRGSAYRANEFLRLVDAARQATKAGGVRSRRSNLMELSAEDEALQLGLSRNKAVVGEPSRRLGVASFLRILETRLTSGRFNRSIQFILCGLALL